jgi:hypothetical protein
MRTTPAGSTAFVPNAGVGAIDIKNQTDPGFFWKYDHFDQANRTFVYAAHGGITETATLSGTCFGTGSGSASHAAWPFPDTDFAIDYARRTTTGRCSRSPRRRSRSRPLQCTMANPPPLMQPWLDITTFGASFAPVSTPVGARTLKDNGTQLTITYAWKFTADVP